MPWTTPETFTAGQTLTAASMNVLSGNDGFLYKPPMCIVKAASGVATSNAGWGIGATTDWASSTDTDAMYTAANRYIEIKTAGMYLVTFGGAWAADGDGDRLVAMSLNDTSTTSPTSGKVITACFTKAITISDTTTAAAAIVSLAVGDKLRLHIYQNSGGNLVWGTAASGFPYYTASWIGNPA